MRKTSPTPLHHATQYCVDYLQSKASDWWLRRLRLRLASRDIPCFKFSQGSSWQSSLMPAIHQRPLALLKALLFWLLYLLSNWLLKCWDSRPTVHVTLLPLAFKLCHKAKRADSMANVALPKILWAKKSTLKVVSFLRSSCCEHLFNLCRTMVAAASVRNNL